MDSYFSILIIVGSFLVATMFPKFISLGLKGIALELVVIFIGLLLGKYFLNLINYSFFLSIEPLFLAALAWVGLLVGEQFNVEMLKKFDRKYYYFSFLEMFFPFIFVYFALLGFSKVVYMPVERWTTFLLLATLSVFTSIFHIYLNSKSKDIVANFLKFSSSFVIIIGIFVFQLILFLNHPVNTLFERIFSPVEWLAIMVFVGLLIGILYIFLTRPKLQNTELSVINLGFVLLIGGVSNIFFVTPLFLGEIVGMLLTNFSTKNDFFYGILQKGEKPAFLMILFLSGLIWMPGEDWHISIIVSLVYVISRASGKFFSGMVFGKRFLKIKKGGFIIDWTYLIPQGSVVLMLAVNYNLIYSDRESNFVLSVILLSYILNYLLGELLLTEENKII